MLGQPLLEDLGQNLLGRVLVGARRATFEVRMDIGPAPRAQSSSLVVQEMLARFLAVHAALYLA